MHHRKPPKKADQAQAYVDQKLVSEHMRQLAQSELDGSPNKGPKKQLKVLADALDRTIETGASASNMQLARTAMHEPFRKRRRRTRRRWGGDISGVECMCAHQERVICIHRVFSLYIWLHSVGASRDGGRGVSVCVCVLHRDGGRGCGERAGVAEKL